MQLPAFFLSTIRVIDVLAEGPPSSLFYPAQRMATMLETASSKRLLEQIVAPESSRPAKRFKISDLPLTASQKAGIDGLAHTIKKRGIYDKLRHDVLAQFNESVWPIRLLSHTLSAQSLIHNA